jgi:cytochrome c oxidase subunit 3
MVLFIVSERAFFRGLLWRFLNCALMPTVQIGITWPPIGIVPVDTWHLPFANTLILLLSYFTANRRKHRLDNNKKSVAGGYLLFTVRLGRIFMYGQYLEYTTAAFTFSDTVYGSSFYLTTGFHGFHVLIGRVYLAVCYRL